MQFAAPHGKGLTPDEVPRGGDGVSQGAVDEQQPAAEVTEPRSHFDFASRQHEPISDDVGQRVGTPGAHLHGAVGGAVAIAVKVVKPPAATIAPSSSRPISIKAGAAPQHGSLVRHEAPPREPQ